MTSDRTTYPLHPLLCSEPSPYILFPDHASPSAYLVRSVASCVISLGFDELISGENLPIIPYIHPMHPRRPGANIPIDFPPVFPLAA